MTATTKPPKRANRPRPRPVRFSSMESLGFSNTASVWSDNPIVDPPAPHPHPSPQDSTEPSITDWQPADVGARLAGGNVRWGVFAAALMLMIGAGAAAFWLYQRPKAEATAAVTAVDVEATALARSLPDLERLDTALASSLDEMSGIEVTAVGEAARRLFDAGAGLPTSHAQARFLATGAATSALDGVRLAEEARAYSLAMRPVLVGPALETDPAVIALDDAVRAFGNWQLWFDEVRTALPDSVLPQVTEQLDVLSGDLSDVLGRYVDALRLDDQAAAAATVAELTERLDSAGAALTMALGEVSERVSARIAETQTALERLSDARPVAG